MNKANSLALALSIFSCLLSAQEFRVKQLFPGNIYSNFVHYQGQLHFTRSNGTFNEWYKLEANGDTTFVDMGMNFNVIQSITAIDTCLFFGGRIYPDPYNYGIEPYCYCGDSARLIGNLTWGGANINQISSFPTQFMKYNDKVVFRAKHGSYPSHAYQLIVYDPDSASWSSFLNAFSDTVISYISINELTIFRGDLLV